MNLVRCPNCQTVFRLRPEQLEAHGGMVRCGQCYSPFNALDHLMDESLRPQASSPPPHPENVPEQRTPPTETPEAAETPQGDAFILEDATALDLSWEDAHRWDFDAPTELPPDAFTTTPERPPPPPSTFDRVADRLEFEIPDAFLPARHTANRAIETQRPPSPNESGTYSASPHGPAAERDDTRSGMPRADEVHPALAAYMPITEIPDPEADEPVAHDDLPTDDEPVEEPAESPESQAHETPHDPPPLKVDPNAWRRPASYDRVTEPASGARWLGGLVVGVLLGALVAQAAFLFRGEITRSWPELRPLYLHLCDRLGCEVPLPRVPAAIQVTSSHLESDPANPVRYVLHARIRNQAPHPQTHPHLELTLTDVRERPVVRRVLLPDEWVATERIESGFQAGEEIEISLPFEAKGVTSAVGYRVYAFFP